MFKFLKSKKKLIEEIEELADGNYKLRSKLQNEQAHSIRLKQEIRFLRKRGLEEKEKEFIYSTGKLGMASAMTDAMERAVRKSKEEAIREKIYNQFIDKINTKGWHERSCPANTKIHSDSKCNCLLNFIKKQANRIIKGQKTN